MRLLDFFYYMVYCSVREDNNASWPKHQRALYLLEGIIVQLSFCITMILIGVFNIQTENLIVLLGLGMGYTLAAYYMLNRYYLKYNRYEQIISHYQDTSKSKKRLYAVMTIVMFLISFILMIVAGITMSYLRSLHGF